VSVKTATGADGESLQVAWVKELMGPETLSWQVHRPGMRMVTRARDPMSRPTSAFTHDWIWQAIDALAARHGLTPSALAKLAGLDPTTFNMSKRFSPEGRPRWPSTESIAKVLEATGTPLDEFASLELANSI